MANVKRTQRDTTDRFQFDLRECLPIDGWAQLDTNQDDDRFGNWVNPLTFELISFCAGKVTHTRCKNEDEFIVALRACVDWHKEKGYFIGIDPMHRPDIRHALVAFDFGRDLQAI